MRMRPRCSAQMRCVGDQAREHGPFVRAALRLHSGTSSSELTRSCIYLYRSVGARRRGAREHGEGVSCSVFETVMSNLDPLWLCLPFRQ